MPLKAAARLINSNRPDEARITYAQIADRQAIKPTRNLNVRINSSYGDCGLDERMLQAPGTASRSQNHQTFSKTNYDHTQVLDH